jgi:hypothetical protein
MCDQIVVGKNLRRGGARLLSPQYLNEGLEPGGDHGVETTGVGWMLRRARLRGTNQFVFSLW